MKIGPAVFGYSWIRYGVKGLRDRNRSLRWMPLKRHPWQRRRNYATGQISGAWQPPRRTFRRWTSFWQRCFCEKYLTVQKTWSSIWDKQRPLGINKCHSLTIQGMALTIFNLYSIRQLGYIRQNNLHTEHIIFFKIINETIIFLHSCFNDLMSHSV